MLILFHATRCIRWYQSRDFTHITMANTSGRGNNQPRDGDQRLPAIWRAIKEQRNSTKEIMRQLQEIQEQLQEIQE